jgi:CorA-like Mg2+ transporter protein
LSLGVEVLGAWETNRICAGSTLGTAPRLAQWAYFSTLHGRRPRSTSHMGIVDELLSARVAGSLMAPCSPCSRIQPRTLRLCRPKQPAHLPGRGRIGYELIFLTPTGQTETSTSNRGSTRRSKQPPAVGDLSKPNSSEIDEIVDALDLPDQLREELHSDGDGIQLHRYPNCIHLVVEVLEADEDGAIGRQQLELIAGKGYVVTISATPLSPVANFVDGMKGDTHLGGLGSAGFLAAIVDSVLNSYLYQVEQVERRIDELDLMALDSDITDGFLPNMVDLRKRIARIRRSLVAHRAAFAPLARPDFALHESSVSHSQNW